jgi:hypothetical protein
MKKSILINGKKRNVMTDGEDNAYTPQGALMSALEDRPGIFRICINYIDRKRDEVRNETTN